MPRDPNKVSAGLVAPEESAEPELYVTGSKAADEIVASYDSESQAVSLTLGSGSEFDAAPSPASGCEVLEPDQAECALSAPPDSIVLAGMAGNDTLTVAGFPDITSIVELGGEGEDSLTGSAGNEDLLADGPGDDLLAALGGDDALLNNEGEDTLDGGTGSDLLLSDSLCDGDTLNGGAGEYRDNASWTKLKEPVEARLDTGEVGRPTGGAAGLRQRLRRRDGEHRGPRGQRPRRRLLRRRTRQPAARPPRPDSYFALDGNDTILANSGDYDLIIDCGAGAGDTAFIDRPTEKYADPPPVGCEIVYEADPNSFRPPGTPTGPPAPPLLQPAPALRDRKPPLTRILHRPRKLILTHHRRKVVFAFSSNEPGSRFRCRLDRGRFGSCRSPRAYRLPPGRHVFEVFAIDGAGNRDRSPALFRFAVRKFSGPLSQSQRRRGRTR